jgi:hypothetical protein
MYGYLQRLQLETLASSYSDIFLVTALITLLGVLLAIPLRAGPAKGASAAPPEL